MLRNHARFSKSLFLLLFLMVCFTRLSIVTKASTSYAGAAKPMEFYFHYLDRPVRVAGLETKYVMNTTRSFQFLTREDAYANSFFKPVGLPKVEVDFYLYPNLASAVTIDGTWQVFIWVNGSAYKPVGFTLQFKEITVGGGTLWDSGPISPTVTSSVGDYIDVPMYNYNLSTPLAHTFNAGTTLLIAVEVNAGSSAATRIWYDSPFYPSKAILPAKDYARPVDVKTYTYDNHEATLFHYNWSLNQRIVRVRANVSDPFGGYDIHKVNITILDPNSHPVIDNMDMIRTSNDLASFSYTFEANWSYPTTAQLGNYTVKVSVIDNNGYYRNLDTGSYVPFIEHFTHIFSIGIVVYYNPAFQIVDDTGAPVPNAQVYITWPNGSRDELPRYTSAIGFINLTHVLPADYEFTILWKDVVIQQTTIDVHSDGPYTIRTDVYSLTITVLGNDRSAIHGAYVIIYTQNEIGYGLALTDSAGQAVFKLPKGTYNIEVHYSTGYWLEVVSTTERNTGVSLRASTSQTMVLTEFPPLIWTTTGFWILVALVAVSIVVSISIVFLRHRYRLVGAN